MPHDLLGVASLLQQLGHLVLLLLAVLDAVDADVGDQRDTGSHAGGGAALGVLDGDALFGLDAQLLTGVQVDLRVRLAAGRVQARCGAVDFVVGEELVHAALVQAGDDAGLGARADDGHGVSLFLQVLQRLGRALALDGFLGQLGRHATEFHVDVLVDLVLG